MVKLQTDGFTCVYFGKLIYMLVNVNCCSGDFDFG